MEDAAPSPWQARRDSKGLVCSSTGRLSNASSSQMPACCAEGRARQVVTCPAAAAAAAANPAPPRPRAALQAPPHFLVARLLRDWLVGEPRWPLLVSDLRLVSRGWREAVADTLPVLAPSDSVARPAAAAAVVAAVASALPSLNLLQLSGVTQLGPVCAGCTALRALRLLDCHSPEQAEPAFPTTDELQQLSRLRQLRSLEIAAPGWQAKAQSLAPLAALSQLERLSIRCNAIISVSGAQLSSGRDQRACHCSIGRPTQSPAPPRPPSAPQAWLP